VRDTPYAIKPIILYNSEIWYMEDYYYIYKVENRSKSHGSNCDKLSFVDRFSFEKLHHEFCKAVLGIKKKKNAFSPFIESSWADLLNLPLLSIMFPRKLYSLASAKDRFL
jgi:hypothetical protein